MNYKNLYDDFKSLDSAQNGPQDLEHSHKVDIISVNHFINEFAQFSSESLVLFEPGCSEMKTQRSPVGFKMAIEVVSQNSGKLVRSLNIGARRN